MDSLITLVNREYLIRITPKNEKQRLIGAGTLWGLLGELAEKNFKRVLYASSQNTTIKIRNRLKIEFHRK